MRRVLLTVSLAAGLLALAVPARAQDLGSLIKKATGKVKSKVPGPLAAPLLKKAAPLVKKAGPLGKTFGKKLSPALVAAIGKAAKKNKGIGRDFFVLADVNRDGRLSRDEFRAMMARRLGGAMKLPTAELDRMFRLMDINGDGFITRAEKRQYEAGLAVVATTKGAPKPGAGLPPPPPPPPPAGGAKAPPAKVDQPGPFD